MGKKVILTWSGGKDSALALHNLQNDKEYQLVGLLTTITDDYDRVSMHGIRRALLEQQAKSLGLLLDEVFIPKKALNETYEKKMQDILEKYRRNGIDLVAFGDIFFEEVRSYRENNLEKLGMKGLFPLWKKDSKELASSFLDLGFHAIITCVDSHFLNGQFVGRQYDKDFLSDLPSSIDPCGENGEFHSFVYDGPVFKKEIPYKKGDIVLRENRFYYCDLVPPSIQDPVNHRGEGTE
jgi:uncharacterized protein (TIGR00290 family)